MSAAGLAGLLTSGDPAQLDQGIELALQAPLPLQDELLDGIDDATVPAGHFAATEVEQRGWNTHAQRTLICALDTPRARALRAPVTHLNLNHHQGALLRDLRSARGLVNLSELLIWAAPNVESLDGVQDTALTKLLLPGARRLTDLSPLADLPLQTLVLRGVGASTTQGLPGSLRALNLSGARALRELVDLPPGLRDLELSGCRGLTSLRALAGLPLRRLVVRDCALSDLDGVDQLAELRTLDLSDTHVLDPSALFALATQRVPRVTGDDPHALYARAVPSDQLLDIKL